MAMQSSGRAQNTMHRVLSILVLTTILSASAACGATSGSTTTPASEHDWRTKIVQVLLPKKGCFTAAYPSLQWQAVACSTTKVTYPSPPRHGPQPNNVGNTNGDVSAHAPTGFISRAIGSFDPGTNVSSESRPIANSGPSIPKPHEI